MFAVAEAADLSPEQMFKARLALDERQLRRAISVQKQQVKGEEDELIRAALIHSHLEPAKDWHAIAIEGA